MFNVAVGVVGWCPPTKVDIGLSIAAIHHSFDLINLMFADERIVMVSGLTNLGIMRDAYPEAVHRGWYTVGFASEVALSFELFPVAEKHIIGSNWGDESAEFIRYLKSFKNFGVINIAGGKQSTRETEEVFKAGGFIIQVPLKRE